MMDALGGQYVNQLIVLSKIHLYLRELSLVSLEKVPQELDELTHEDDHDNFYPRGTMDVQLTYWW